MRVRALVLAAVAVTLTRELVTRDGLGLGEYVSTSALVAGLLVLGFRACRRAVLHA